MELSPISCVRLAQVNGIVCSAEPKPITKEDQPRKMATNKIFIIFYSTLVFFILNLFLSSYIAQGFSHTNIHITPAGQLCASISQCHTLCIEHIV